MSDLNNNLYDEANNNLNDISEETNNIAENINAEADSISENINDEVNNIEENINTKPSDVLGDVDSDTLGEADMHTCEADPYFEEVKAEAVPNEQPAKKKKKYSYNKSIAVGLAGVILCGASLGFFLGVGLNISDKVTSGVSDIANGNFSFENNTDSTANVTPVNLVADEDSISKTVASVENSVVNVSIKTTSVDFFNQTYESEGAGSGIIYKIDGDTVYIVTNNHVVENASTATISITGTEQISAKLVGKDSTADIAVISVSKKDIEAAGITDVKAAVFSDSSNVEVGESVIAIGNALGRGKTATLGIISAANKEISIDGKKFNFIQTDAAINPGNSGGALINTSGEVIGINTAKLSSSSVEGTGYAIPSSTAKEVADQLITNGSVKRAALGVTGVTITDNFKFLYGINVDGIYINKVEEGSAAESAGIQVSDIITAVDGQSVATNDELSSIISSHKPNDKIKVSIIRNGVTPAEIEVTLGNANDSF